MSIESKSGDIELSIIVPVFNEAGNIEEFLRRIRPILDSCVQDYEILFAVDPSTDGTEELIRQQHVFDNRVKMLVFSRRFGQPSATLAGLEYSSGAAAIVMDVDLQDPPELIPQMVSRWREGFDVVYAQRRRRDGETLVKRIVAKVGYGVISRFGDVDIPRDTGDFRLMSRRVVEELSLFQEAHGFLRGLVALVGHRQTSILFDRPARHSGRGHYNRFFGSLKIGFNGLIGFSTALLNLSTVFGLVAATLAFTTGASYGVLKLAGFNFPVGNPTIVILILFIGGLQLICLGLMGQYVGRIYEEVKRRPRFIVREAVGVVARS